MNSSFSCSCEAFRIAQGSTAVALLIGTFMAVIIDFFHYAVKDDYSNQQFGFVLATLLHVVGVTLLFDLEYRSDRDTATKDFGDERKPPIITLNIRKGDMATISNITTQSEDMDESSDDGDMEGAGSQQGGQEDCHHKEKYSSFYVSMASISTAPGESGSFEDALDHGATLECAFGFSFPMAQFFVCSVLLSSILLMASLSQQIADINLVTDNHTWTRMIYLVTFGFFLSCTSLSYFKILAVSCDNPVLQDRWLKVFLAGSFGVVTVFFLAKACATRNSLMDQLSPFGSSGSSGDSYQPFWGEAWVSEAQIAYQNEYCVDASDSILVNVTVVYGGDWACPNNPNQLCELPITAQLECTFFQSTDQVHDANEAETKELTSEDYVYLRYHDYVVDDDAAYNYEERPSFQYWNRPAENIIGNCNGACFAKPENWLWDLNRRITQNSYAMYLCLGAVFCFLGWPLLEAVNTVFSGSQAGVGLADP